MKKWISVSAVAILAVAVLTIRPGYSDDTKDGKQSTKTQKPAAAKVTAAKEKPQKATRKKPRGRLPNYYGKVGISDEQRTSIYSIQEKYESQLAELRKQMAALVKQRDEEIQSVLTETQRADLVKAREEAKQKALERARKAAAERAAKKKAAAAADK